MLQLQASRQARVVGREVDIADWRAANSDSIVLYALTGRCEKDVVAAQRVRDVPYTCGREKEDVTVARGEVSERRDKWEYDPQRGSTGPLQGRCWIVQRQRVRR